MDFDFWGMPFFLPLPFMFMPHWDWVFLFNPNCKTLFSNARNSCSAQNRAIRVFSPFQVSDPSDFLLLWLIAVSVSQKPPLLQRCWNSLRRNSKCLPKPVPSSPTVFHIFLHLYYHWLEYSQVSVSVPCSFLVVCIFIWEAMCSRANLTKIR